MSGRAVDSGDDQIKISGTDYMNMSDEEKHALVIQPKGSKSLPFDSELKQVAPHVVILEIIRRAVRNGERFEVDTTNTVSPFIAYSLSIGKDIDEYIARHVQRGGNDLAASDLSQEPPRESAHPPQVDTTKLASIFPELDRRKLAALTQLLLEARIEENKVYRQYVEDWPPYEPISSTRQFCEGMLNDRLAKLTPPESSP